MVNRIKVTLEQPEYSALLKKATAELRNPEDQIRYMVREELRRSGLLTEQYEGNHAELTRPAA